MTSTEPLTTRATRGAYTMPIATITFAVLGPSDAISAIARMMAGNAMRPSITRMTTLSSARKWPATTPAPTPRTNESTTTQIPTRSDSRAPYTTRLSTSRPTSSVPNQCVAPGRLRRAATSIRPGSPAMNGASTASTEIATMITAPTSVILRRDRSESHRGIARHSRAASGRSSGPVARSLTAIRVADGRSPVLHAGIDHEVRQVNCEIDEHRHACDAEYDPLDHGVVTAQHGRDDQSSETGNVEDRLDDNRTRQQYGEADADDRDRRDERVAEGVLVDDEALAEALGPPSHDELLPQDVQHARPCDPRDQRRLHEPERRGRHGE